MMTPGDPHNQQILRAQLGTLESLLTEYERIAASRAAELRQTAAELEHKSCVLEAILNGIPEGVIVCDIEGRLIHVNDTVAAITGLGAMDGDPSQWSKTFGLFQPDTVTPFPPEDLPLARAMRGESVHDVRLFVRHAKQPQGTWVDVAARPIRLADGTPQGAIAVFRDVSEQVRMQETLEGRLLAETEKNEVLERMRTIVRELSTPILEVWDGVLVLPVIGIVDSQRSTEMMARVLEEVSVRQSHFVILDITGVEMIDSAIADQFLHIVKAVELLGAHCILTGVKPDVARTLVDLGVNLGSLLTFRSLRQGLQECLRQMRGAGTRGNRS